MSTHMLFQEHFSRKSFTTFSTFMGLDPGMYAYMHIESNSLIKGFRTVGTFIFLFIAMNFHVTAKITFIIESFSTFWTFSSKFFGSSMYGKMIFVIAQLGETFATISAFIAGRFMCFFMGLKRRKKMKGLSKGIFNISEEEYCRGLKNNGRIWITNKILTLCF